MKLLVPNLPKYYEGFKMKKVIIHNKLKVYDGFYKLYETEVSYERFNSQMTKPLPRLCFERGDSVAAILFNTDTQKAVFVKQFKYPTYEKGAGWILEVVAGMPEAKESMEKALKREVLEETGYEINIKSIELIANFFVSPNCSSDRTFLYYTKITKANRVSEGGGIASEGEDIELVEYSIKELIDLFERGIFQDAKTIIGIQWLLKRLGN